MLVIESLTEIWNVITLPFSSLFNLFPDFKVAFEGLLVITLSYFGWRAIK